MLLVYRSNVKKKNNNHYFKYYRYFSHALYEIQCPLKSLPTVKISPVFKLYVLKRLNQLADFGHVYFSIYYLLALQDSPLMSIIKEVGLPKRPPQGRSDEGQDLSERVPPPRSSSPVIGSPPVRAVPIGTPPKQPMSHALNHQVINKLFFSFYTVYSLISFLRSSPIFTVSVKEAKRFVHVPYWPENRTTPLFKTNLQKKTVITKIDFV